MDKKKKFFAVVVGVMVSAGLGACGTYLANYKKIDFMNRYPELLEIENFAKETLEIGSPENVSQEDAVNAYLSMYGDKYTRYTAKPDIHSKEYVTEETNNSPIAVDMGFEIAFNKEDELYFSKVDLTGKAAKQGIKAGDIIKSIDGETIDEYKTAKQIRGKSGTIVKLLIERDGDEMEVDFLRDVEDKIAVGVEAEMHDDTLLITYSEMTEGSINAIQTALKENEFKSLIIDLRENKGGYTTYPIQIADMFIDKADVKKISKSGTVSIESTADGVEYDVPIYLLVNENTASSAEILTSLLKQYADATIIGTTTFGKGIYQGHAMYKGGNLTYTDGEVYVGEWDCYHGEGIAPDVEVYMDSDCIGTEYDVQLEKALELVK